MPTEWLYFSGISIEGRAWWELALLDALGLILLVALAWGAFELSRKGILRIVRACVQHSKTDLDDAFLEEGVFNRLAHLIPALVLKYTSWFFLTSPGLVVAVERVAAIYSILTVLAVLSACINAVTRICLRHSATRGLPIKGFGQALKIVLFLAGVVLVLSLVFGQEPGYYLAGFGAATAILLLIFRDPILGLVAGVQLSLNDMVQEGDWIEVPKHGADGEVLDVSLTTVKVRNWDKTITTIPAYQLVSDSFKNWRGMSESGGRRIKRALAVDIASVRFLTDGMLERLMSNELLRPALEKRLAEVHRANSKQEADLSEPANGRRLTNLGSFRLYTELYLRNHPHVREDMTFLVRQLDPSPRGIPLEVYVFTDTTDWAAYESIQADIFDHLLAVASRFKLRLFQEPGSGDFAGLEEAVNGALKRR